MSSTTPWRSIHRRSPTRTQRGVTRTYCSGTFPSRLIPPQYIDGSWMPRARGYNLNPCISLFHWCKSVNLIWKVRGRLTAVPDEGCGVFLTKNYSQTKYFSPSREGFAKIHGSCFLENAKKLFCTDLLQISRTKYIMSPSNIYGWMRSSIPHDPPPCRGVSNYSESLYLNISTP